MNSNNLKRRLLAEFLAGRVSMEALKEVLCPGELVGVSKEVHPDGHELDPGDLVTTNHPDRSVMTYQQFEELAKLAKSAHLVVLRESDMRSDKA